MQSAVDRTRSPRPQAVPAASGNPGHPRLLALIVATAAVVPFLGVLSHPFLNWDDPVALVNNPALRQPGVVRWAFSTTLLEHVQPLAWLAWAGVARAAGVVPTPFHLLNLLGHGLNAILVYRLALVLGRQRGRLPSWGPVSACAGAVLFAVHPMQVEAVAWAAAFPYVLALAFLLMSALAWCRRAESAPGRARTLWAAASVVAFGLSLLSREYALAFPLVLVLMDAWLLQPARRGAGPWIDKAPFIALVVGGALLEASARSVATLGDLPATARLALAVETPLTYLGRLLAPFWLSPVYPLPIVASARWWQTGFAVVVLFALAAWLRVRRHDRLAVALGSALLLIAPTLIAPSGLAASADRYMYMASVPLALAAGVWLTGEGSASRETQEIRVSGAGVVIIRRAAVAGLAVVLAILSARQASAWRDSISLWTHAVVVDPGNDIATYNLAAVYAETGQRDLAVRWYERTLALVPDHDQARRNRDTLLVDEYEREATRLAAEGEWTRAMAMWDQVLTIDATRPRARAGRGIAEARTGAWQPALEDLVTARQAGLEQPEMLNALALSLVQLGREADAVAVLKDALRVAPNDINLAQNLARLLLDARDDRARDPVLALRLAREIDVRTGGRDPRARAILEKAIAMAAGRTQVPAAPGRLSPGSVSSISPPATASTVSK